MCVVCNERAQSGHFEGFIALLLATARNTTTVLYSYPSRKCRCLPILLFWKEYFNNLHFGYQERDTNLCFKCIGLSTLVFFFLKNYGSYSQVKNVEEGGLLSLIHHTQPFHCCGLIPTFASQNRQLELRTSLIVEKIPSAHTKIISLDAKALKCSFLSSRDHVYRRDAILIF